MKINTIKSITHLNKLMFVMFLFLSAISQVGAQGSGWPTTSINVTEFSFAPSTIDTTNSSQTVAITVGVTDTERDFWSMDVTFKSPRGSRYGYDFGIQDRISGDGRDGVYRKAVTFYQYAEAGTWDVDKIFVYDGTGSYYRWRQFFTSELVASGFSTQLQVINNNEAVPPDISDFSFTPSTINANSGSRNVTITLRAKDETSGIRDISVGFSNPPGCYFYDDDCVRADFPITSADRISGDEHNGVYRVVATTPQNISMGVYSASVFARDTVQNSLKLNSAELAAMGYPSQLRIFGTDGLTVSRSDDRNSLCLPGDCSLREAVNAANASPAADAINFASGLASITLTNEIVIHDAGALTISGPGANVLTIDGGPGTNRIFLIDSTATATISGMTLTGGNGAGNGTNGNGGAIYVYGGELALDSVRVTGNTATGFGGGVCYLGGNRGRIINSTFSSNNSGCGGGVSNLYGSMTIVNSTISGNTSNGYGGGICISSDFGTTVALRNVTVTNNTAQQGGGIQNEVDYPGTSRLNLGNSIVAGNNATTGIAPEILTYPSLNFITSSGGNLFGDSQGDSPNSGLVYQPTDIRDTNPLLGPLANNGGTTSTHAILPGSPLIDRGLNTLVSPIALAFDQRGAGFARIRDGNADGKTKVDIGAFEAQLGSTGSKPTPFDYDGDGRADISVFRPTDRIWYLNRSQAGFAAVQFGLATDTVVSGDFDGDGKADVAVWRQSDGTWYWINSETGQFAAAHFGKTGDIPQPGDFDGDGKDDLTVFRPSDGNWYRLNSSDGQFVAAHFGQNRDLPAGGDYDGDGKCDMAVFRPSEGNWYRLNSGNGLFSGIHVGQNGDVPTVADYDGDGHDDISVFRPSDGNWYISKSIGGQAAAVHFGQQGDIPVPADYDGDGKADITVFRPSSGIWFSQQSTSGFVGTQFGLNGDKPVPAGYVPVQ